MYSVKHFPHIHESHNAFIEIFHYKAKLFKARTKATLGKFTTYPLTC